VQTVHQINVTTSASCGSVVCGRLKQQTSRSLVNQWRRHLSVSQTASAIKADILNIVCPLLASHQNFI